MPKTRTVTRAAHSRATVKSVTLCRVCPALNSCALQCDTLFHTLSVPCIMAVFSALLSEQRMIMVSENPARLSECMHGFCAVLYPFNWQQIFVPLLPKVLIDYLTAPMPFLIGMHISLLEKVRQLPTEVRRPTHFRPLASIGWP